ncbi:hypothetical protein A3718_10960 [Erythrobacter sp. HI0019]|uniref:hypothetical protein n=2 Tax=unclassified Erythrobacter TaxID=2633097 RepID=UPI0007B7E17B|nr:hypothetical protein [Erythrobacter sp. HI0028]KZX92850.1 hypothetical protein A3718_10960 [Erythrobacter sp. HI0019]KZY01012.1 hypothetical protein A3723_06325 [Erythrobacter sp. HI0028]
MAETSDQFACASLHGFALERDLPLGATVTDPGKCAKILDHYRRASRDMRDNAGEYLEADPYFAEARQIPSEAADDGHVNSAFTWALVAIAIETTALCAWWAL